MRRRAGFKGAFLSNIIRIGRASEVSVNSVFQEHEVMREADGNETSGELATTFDGTLVEMSQLKMPSSDPLIKSAIYLPLVSVDLEYHDGWCLLKSYRIKVSGIVKSCSIED